LYTKASLFINFTFKKVVPIFLRVFFLLASMQTNSDHKGWSLVGLVDGTFEGLGEKNVMGQVMEL
jgi:hypothetical protein